VNGFRFRILVFALNSGVNSQPKASKVRDDKLGSSVQVSAAEKGEGRIVHIIGLEE
jgi:hypothetical protein